MTTTTTADKNAARDAKILATMKEMEANAKAKGWGRLNTIKTIAGMADASVGLTRESIKRLHAAGEIENLGSIGRPLWGIVSEERKARRAERKRRHEAAADQVAALAAVGIDADLDGDRVSMNAEDVARLLAAIVAN